MTAGLPWYRHGMVWLVLGLPALAVVVGITLVIVASNGPTDLVRSDWYKHGRAVNEDLSRVHAAHRLGLSAEAGINGRLLTLRLHGPADPDALVLHLVHPTLAAQDQRLLLARVGPGLFQTRLATALPPGPRRLQLQAPDGQWRLEGHGQLHGTGVTLAGLAP